MKIKTFELLMNKLDSLKGRKPFRELSENNQLYIMSYCVSYGIDLTVAHYNKCVFTELDTIKIGGTV